MSDDASVVSAAPGWHDADEVAASADPAGHRSEEPQATFAPDPENLGYVLPGVPAGPAIGPWGVYAAIVVALVLAGWLSTRRLVGSAEALPFGARRSTAVLAVGLVDRLAGFARLDRPDELVQAALGRAGPGAPVVGGPMPAPTRTTPTAVPTLAWATLLPATLVPAVSPRTAVPATPSPPRGPASWDAGRTEPAPTVTSPPTALPRATALRPHAQSTRQARPIRTPERGTTTRAGTAPPHRVAAARTATRPPRGTPTPALRRLSAEEPLAVLVAGDSMAEPLGYEIWNLSAEDGLVSAGIDFRISSGLARPDYYDWPARLASLMAASPAPEAVVFFVGGNEDQNLITDSGTIAEVGTSEWAAEYRRRAARVMDIVTRGGARLYWIGLPAMADERHDIVASAINQAARAEAGRRKGVVFVDIAPWFAGPDGGFAPYLPDADGEMTEVRQEDGIHLTRTGTDWVAAKLYAQMLADWGVRAGQRSPTPTPRTAPSRTPTPRAD